MLHCVCLVYKIHKQHNESTHPSKSLFSNSECASSPTRNKAKNALSLAKSISPEMAGAKIGNFSFTQGKSSKNS